MSRVFWDTNVYIYLLEDFEPWSSTVKRLRNRMQERGDQLVTSTLTLGEILVKPTAKGDTEICRKYVEGITAASQIVPFDMEAAKRYAVLRCDRSLRSPDAIQLACASVAGVDLFVTNDSRLHGKLVVGIQFIVSLDRVPI
ncbi:MAG: type II toxin-antitoxin system VapC family toxin [Candidatus Acidiferrum sp.]|jgi:predicted nucleic acid-binding protein